MYRGGRRGRGRGGGPHHGRHGDRRPRIPRKKQYFETDVTSSSAVLLTPISEELKWKFTQMRHDNTEEDYTRYELKLGEERFVRRSVPRHSDNLQDIRGILFQKLREALGKQHSCQLDCQARLGKLVWLGELLERVQVDIPRMQLHQFEGPPHYNEDRTPVLKYEYITRANVKSSILTELEQRHGAHDPSHLSLQIRMRDSGPDGIEYVALVSKEPETGKFLLKKLTTSSEKVLSEFASDILCFGRHHDVRISTKCCVLEEPPASRNTMKIIDSITISEHGELKMILKSGPLRVELIRQREKHIFHVKGENDWEIKYSTIKEHPLSSDHYFIEDAVVTLDAGYDNKEVEVLLDHQINEDDNIREKVEEIMRLIEFSLEIAELGDEHLDSAP